jgi:hypothetical protein
MPVNTGKTAVAVICYLSNIWYYLDKKDMPNK